MCGYSCWVLYVLSAMKQYVNTCGAYRYLLGVSAVGSILLMFESYYYVMDVWHYSVLKHLYSSLNEPNGCSLKRDWERYLACSYSKPYQ